jgi:HK97 family phage major capsid protein
LANPDLKGNHMTLEQLRAALAKHLGALDDFEKSIVDESGEAREYSADELVKLEELTAAVEQAEKSVAAKERSEKARAAAGAATPADGNAGKVPAQVKDEKRFKSFGEQLQAIVNAGMNKGVSPDPRLIYQKASGANEAVPSEGGFLVQTDFSTELMGLMHEMGQVVARVRKIPISGNSNGIKLPAINETSRATGSRFGGIRGYWASEGNTVTSSKPAFRSIELGLEKLMAIGYATDELLADAVAMEAIYKQGMAEELTFLVENAIYSGTGSGQPLGFLNSGALVTVSKEGGQAANTVVSANVLKMVARLPARSMRNSVWLINQDILPQLWSLTIGSGTATHLMFAPPGLTGDNVNAPWGTLMGRPVIPVEYASTLGTVGDIALVDLSQYLMIDKGGPAAAESMHVRFLYEEMTFRITYRVDGQPAWNTPMTPFKGSATQSPFIVLETRS